MRWLGLLLLLTAATFGMVAAQNPQLFHLALGEFTRRVGEILGKVIDLKKLLKGQTYNTEVKGDNKKEADETFYLDLFGNSGNSLFTRNRGLGTILNDD